VDFSKNLRAFLFNKYLSNEHYFSRIHDLAGKYLLKKREEENPKSGNDEK
jgi:hypothetical protein